ncbi:hypothetical protein LMH87_010110 [Akanthomyces muscarius]|uniref:Uncharacterized protein n=1 Tax=Akanthomyces muscarius TaxID=2231603 RepID=A0A9W8QDH7_AKAMU|nr:hypothetical protein LMH87_010110 [Akanthomyces muscarius]KAJ4153630.1 hypothetical protein LMH87_010110 [Akanthomyces muscarius]
MPWSERSKLALAFFADETVGEQTMRTRIELLAQDTTTHRTGCSQIHPSRASCAFNCHSKLRPICKAPLNGRVRSERAKVVAICQATFSKGAKM